MKKFLSFLFAAALYLTANASHAFTASVPFLEEQSAFEVLLRPSAPPAVPLGNSQFNPNFMYLGENVYINVLKTFAGWTFGNNSGHPNMADVNSRGYPLPAGNCFSNGGCYSGNNFIPSQYASPGNWTQIGIGQGTASISNQTATNSPGTGVACSGVQTGVQNVGCNNQSCTNFTAGITGNVLTVTVAGSCSLLLYQPISAAGITIGFGGIPTAIVGNAASGATCGGGACTGAGSTGTYLVNWSQTISPGTSFVPGLYNEVSTPNEIVLNATNWQASWNFSISASSATNPLDYMAMVQKQDLPAYYSGQTAGVKFKQRVKAANFLVMRGLNLEGSNLSTVTTFASTKDSNYWSYTAKELRTTACSGATVSPCNGGSTTYSLNGSIDQYSVSLGVANPPDKFQVCAAISTTATNSTVSFSTDGGTTYYPVKDYRGNTLTVGANTPSAIGRAEGFTFEAYNQVWLSSGSNVNGGCLDNYSPPAAIVQLNQELGTVPWTVMPMYASIPITDYPTQYQTLINQYSWPRANIWEGMNEIWNNSGHGTAPYASFISRVFIARDPTHWSNGPIYNGSGGDVINYQGMAGSLLAQSIRQLSSSAAVRVGTQTTWAPVSTFAPMVRSNSYVTQNPALLPIQSGCAGVGAVQTNCPAPFTQTPFYQAAQGSTADAGGIVIANYWSVGGMLNNAYVGTPTTSVQAAEIAFAYCYFYQSAGCASQSSIMSSYFSTTQPITQNSGGVIASSTTWAGWYNSIANNCGSSCGAFNPLKINNYEGTLSQGHTSIDGRINASSATAATNAVFAVTPNPCFAGQTVTPTGLSGTGWSGVTGSFTVQATGTDATHCALNLNSTGFGSFATATASSNFGAFASSVSISSCPTLSGGIFGVFDQTNGFFIGIANSCTSNTISGFLTSDYGPNTRHGGASGDTLVFQPILNFTGSANYVNYLRDYSYASPDLATWTTTLYNTIASTSGACAPAKCSDYPSQFNLAGTTVGNGDLGGCCWSTWARDLFTGPQVASSSAATATGGNLTINGTVAGLVTSGLTIIGGGISGATVTGACSKTGSLPAGGNAGDVCPISSGATMSSNSIIFTVAPTSSTNNPITSWPAICTWNGVSCP